MFGLDQLFGGGFSFSNPSSASGQFELGGQTYFNLDSPGSEFGATATGVSPGGVVQAATGGTGGSIWLWLVGGVLAGALLMFAFRK